MVNAPFAVFPSILVSPAEDSNPFVRFGQDFSKKPKRGHPEMRGGKEKMSLRIFP
jgi:hypothetical protein